jgi:N-acetylglutamate synthase-like GNAT family acetyltransferase
MSPAGHSADIPEPNSLEPFEINETVDPKDVQFLDDRIYEFNAEQTGISDARLLSIILRDEQNAIFAGLYGWTWGKCCEVRILWVDEHRRRRGLGERLMAAAEAEARARGATQIVLSTHSFQAPEFYARLGFESVGQVDDYPIGHQSIFLRKVLR